MLKQRSNITLLDVKTNANQSKKSILIKLLMLLTITSLLLTTYFLWFSTLTLAITPTPTASSSTKIIITQTPTPPTVSVTISHGTDDQNNDQNEATSTQKLKERIEKIVAEKKEQIETKMAQNLGTIGELIRVTEETMTLKNSKGNQILTINADLQIIKDKKIIPLNRLAVGDWLVVIGIKIDDNLTPKRIYAYTKMLHPQPHNYHILTITKREKNKFTGIDRKTNEEMTFVITDKTKILNNDGSKISISKIEENMQLIVVTVKDNQDANDPQARLIRSLANISDNN